MNTDARHKVTLSALYRTPFGLNLSGIARYHSGTPYTDWAGKDLDNDGFAFDLPSDVPHVNTLRGASFSQVDVRASYALKFFGNYGVEFIGEMFNLLNSKNSAHFIGNRLAANYRQPTAYAGDPLQGEQRLAQLGLRVTF
jgi:hypothetical protein